MSHRMFPSASQKGQNSMPRYNPCQDTQHHQHIHPVSNQAWADNVIFLFPHSSTLTQRSVPGPPLPKEAPTIHPFFPTPTLKCIKATHTSPSTSSPSWNPKSRSRSFECYHRRSGACTSSRQRRRCSTCCRWSWSSSTSRCCGGLVSRSVNRYG